MVKICDTAYASQDEEQYLSHFQTFDFPLSDFQKHAIESIVTGNHTLVTAHTGSGKTLPAEFALQYFVGQGKKVIYTSPIKALSNQKYYEFTKKYPHISFGLLTGDIKINPMADVLIMTAEILMNYLFLNNNNQKPTTANSLQFQMDIQTELACVVMDEVHYINDLERGQVWEKTILMVPDNVQMVMLSATIDSPERFAQWCEDSHPNSGKQVFLASTNHRVVPLTHYAYLTTSEAIFKKVTDKSIQAKIKESTNTLIPLRTANGEFQTEGYLKINHITSKIFEPNQVFMKRAHVLNNLTQYLKNEDMLPAIAFVFSRKNVELFAKEVTTVLLEDDSKIPYTVRRECEQIVRRLPNFQEYLTLPEYNQLVSLLEKGIGIHHSGMIPILREIVELMISKKYIKLLFATESFAIGLDCPIRTAVFTSLTKFDGNYQRFLMAHEYTQMAGRAGRRGIDTVGHVVHCNNLFKLPTQLEYKTILGGKPQCLQSKFKISFPLILNLIKNNSKANFQQFVEKSMIFNELQTERQQQTDMIDVLTAEMRTMEKSLGFIKTPLDVCYKYLELMKSIPSLVNKKRKEAERAIQSMLDEHRTIRTDLLTVEKYKNLQDKINVEQGILKGMTEFIDVKIGKICQILEETHFIVKNSEDEYTLTQPLGKLAANIAEINGVVFAEMIVKTNYFETFSVKQLIGLFSCFTDVKVAEDQRLSIPRSSDAFLQSNVLSLHDLYKKYEDIEFAYNIFTGVDYENALIYDMLDIVDKWCDCQNETECKYFVYSVLKEKEISIGDFTKAILKISTIGKEITGLCEENGLVDLMHKLSQIDGMILKYITTTQSLYI
jgi:antiviral helicase SKI2